MERWAGSIAVVTGSSAGIGLAISRALVENGLKVVGLARRREKMEKEMIGVKGPGKFYARECDVTDEKQVDQTFDWIESNLGTVNILINNAGSAKRGTFEEVSNEDIRNILNLNVMGLIYCSKRAIKLMKKNGGDAHIINMNSILGHGIPKIPEMKINIYSPTKFAVTAISQVLQNDLIGTKIRVANVSPGLVETELTQSPAHQGITLKMPTLKPEDIANSVLHIISTPPHVNINELTIRPTGSSF